MSIFRTRTNRRTEHQILRNPTRSAYSLFADLALALVRALLWVSFTAVGIALNMWASVALLLFFAPSNIWSYIAVAFGALLAGSFGGGIMGFGQVLALRRWLDTPASLGSFMSTIIASSLALAAGGISGWWFSGAISAIPGALVGIVLYGAVFGMMQRPMIDYVSRRSALWVAANCAAVVLSTIALLAVFDLSGSKREMLQLRYPAAAYAAITGVALVLLMRKTGHSLANTLSASSAEQTSIKKEPARSELNIERTRLVQSGSALFEVRERHYFEVRAVSSLENETMACDRGAPEGLRRQAGGTAFAKSEPGMSGVSGVSGDSDVIDANYRVIS